MKGLFLRSVLRKIISRPLLSFLCCNLFVACESSSQAPPAKLQIAVAADRFPTGHDSPEGVAADVMRALINRDAKFFVSSCLKPYSAGRSRADYEGFLQKTVQGMKEEAARKKPSPYGPKAIGKVFAARHLSRNGPASYAYSAFGFQDVMFVDVGINLQNGERGMNRTLVIRDKDGKWYVHPAPDVSPLLSTGLNDETRSTADFTQSDTTNR